MKTLLLILLCSSHCCFSDGGFTIRGTVESPLRDYVTIYSRDALSSLVKSDTIRITPQGNFEYQVSLPSFFTLYLEVDSMRKMVVVGHNGESLQLTFSPKENQTGITGSMYRMQLFKMAEREYFDKIFWSYAKHNPEFDKGPNLRTDRYFKILDSITYERIRYLNEYFTNPVTATEKQFIKFYETGYIYSNLFYKQSYPNPPFHKFKFYQEKYQLDPVQCFAFSDLVKFNALDLCYIPEYRNFVNSFIIYELRVRRQRTQTPFSWPEVVESAMRLIDELSSDIEAREGIKAVFLAYVIDEIERDKITAAATDVLSYVKKIKHPSPKPFQELEARLIAVIRDNRFNKGSPAPDFKLMDTLGNIMTLNSFEGKKVIIDIAASWCGPCIAAIPQWNSRVEANTDPGVVFVFLSLDDTAEKWHRFIKKYEIEGLLLFAGNGGFKSKFAHDYELKSLPHQIVIDKTGKLESYKRE